MILDSARCCAARQANVSCQGDVGGAVLNVILLHDVRRITRHCPQRRPRAGGVESHIAGLILDCDFYSMTANAAPKSH